MAAPSHARVVVSFETSGGSFSVLAHLCHHLERETAQNAVEFDCRRRRPRCSLAVEIEITDVESDVQIRGRTNTLSLFGCGVNAVNLFPRGTSVRIKLSHEGTEARALARVVYSRSDLGMGIVFTSVEREDELILEWWIAEFASLPVWQS